MTEPLNSDQRARFAELADILIPEALGMPAASQLTLQEAPLDHVLALRPEIHADLQRGLERSRTLDPRDAAEFLNLEDPAAFGAIGLAASAAYYMHPEVRALLSYPGQTSRPVRPEEENDFLRNNLLQPVIERGAIYRPTPDQGDPS